MNPYNGFSPAERNATLPIQKKAEKEGILVRPDRCEMCGVKGTLMSWHLEDYREPIKDARSLCPECHMRLHARFARPLTWAGYIKGLRHGEQGHYATVGQFMQATNKERWTAERADLDGLIQPMPGRWWEFLSMRPVNLRVGDHKAYLDALNIGRQNNVREPQAVQGALL